MKFIRKPAVTTFTLIVIIAVVYFMTSSSSDSGLGSAAPLSLKKNITPEQVAEALSRKQAPARAKDTDEVIKRPHGGDKKEDLVKDETKDSQDSPAVDNNQQPIVEFTDTPFMPKMANETLKAQLGNAAWKLLHTILARYPDKPSKQEQSTLQQYITLFAQVYPCGDCARHFQKLLAKYPPQTSSRKTAALWGCHIHNKVNQRLDKPDYDCTTILEDYDCGCGSDEKEADFTLGNESMEHLRDIKIDEKQDLQLGG